MQSPSLARVVVTASRVQREQPEAGPGAGNGTRALQVGLASLLIGWLLFYSPPLFKRFLKREMCPLHDFPGAYKQDPLKQE